MSKVLLIIAVVVLVGVVAWIILAFIPQGNDTGIPDMPKLEQATHSVYIENPGKLLLTSDYEVHGDTVDSRLYILHGFWEMRGNKFKFVDGDIILDESIFGKITVKRR